ncbi:MAG: hypothetical protein JXR41_07560, partial [Bacteroidales bacterium]|nr:hypothetical protein [Bacteroidales bacterium]
DLRHEVIEIIEDRLSESEHVPWAKAGQEFHFLRSQIVIFDTGIICTDPKELTGIVQNMSLGSIFYHFIDSRRRTHDKRNDFSVWLSDFNNTYKELIEGLDKIDPYFTTLHELRQEVFKVFHNFFKGGA